MTTLLGPARRALTILWLSCLLPLAGLAQAPVITAGPTNQSAVSGANVSFSVGASGAGPLRYQWRLSATNLLAQTNASLTVSNVNLRLGGLYSVVVTNVSGAVTSAPALLAVDEHLTFRILELQTNGAIALEHSAVTGDDRGGIVVSPNQVFVTGDNATARFSASNLGGGTGLGRMYDGLCSNLRDQRIYTLAEGANPITSSGGMITSLLELDGATGLPNGTRLNLSTNIQMFSGGIFSGYGRVVLWDGFYAYDIALPSGKVTFLGEVPNLNRTFSESWTCWGLAEYFANTLQLVYVDNTGFPYNTISRRPVAPDSISTPVAQLSNLSDMASIGFSISRSRWYFHHEGTSQFRSGDETVGSAKALFTTNAGFPVVYQDPQPQIAYPGDTVRLEVLATGTAPLSYQWRSNGTNIPGATAGTLVLENVQPSSTGYYSVAVGNGFGSMVSGEAYLFIVTAPEILEDPSSRSVLAGTNTSFSVVIQAAPPVSFQWRLNGTNILNATNATYDIPHVTSLDAGNYHVLVTNRYGSATSGVARLALIVEAPFSFQILGLSNDAVTVEHRNITGDDRGGIAVSSERVFVTGDGAMGIFAASDLAGGTASAFYYEALVTDLRSETVYTLGFDGFPLGNGGGTVNSLIEVDGHTGQLSTNRIELSFPIFAGSGSGLFAGYGQVVIHDGANVYSIAVPSGVVTDLGAMFMPSHQFTETWAFWGIAENFGGDVYLVYAQDSISIVRTRVPDGATTTIANFLDLADMASIGASVLRGRWYFHHQGQSQFGGTNETLGFCSAIFSVTANPVIDHFSWEPLAGAQFAGDPFQATLTARTIDNTVVSNFSGQVSLDGFSTINGQPLAVAPPVSGSFVEGVWTGLLTITQPTLGMYIRARDLGGRSGLSSSFAVITTNDLSVVAVASTNVGTIYSALTYNVLITNSGPQVSSGVFATNLLPANVNFVSAVSSQGSCTLNSGAVICDLGTLGSGASVTLLITVVPNSLAALTNVVDVVRSALEDHPENNRSTVITPIALPLITFNDAAAPEGDTSANRGTNVFTVQLNTTSAVPVTVQFATAPGTAVNSGSPDYVNRSGTLTFAPGVVSTNVRVTFAVDRNYEEDEVFYLNFSNAVNAVLVRPQATGTILNDDPQPEMVVTNVVVNEGNAGVTVITVPVRLTSPASVPISLGYATSNGTAVAGSDYVPTNGVLTFASGITNATISLRVIGDTLGESNELFYLNLFGLENITLSTQSVVTILNDDVANTLDHFAWAEIAPTQTLNTPFNITVSARNLFDQPLSNYNGTAKVLASKGFSQKEYILGDVNSPSSFTGGVYTIGFSFTPRTNLYVTHFRHYSGTKVSIWNDTGTLLATRAVTSINGQWVETPLSTPLQLRAGTTYRIGGYNGLETNPWYFGPTLPTMFQDGTVGSSYYTFTDAFPDIDLGSSLYLVDLVYALSLDAFAMSPTNLTLTNGTWSGPVRVLAPASGVQLFASDTNNQVSSPSNPFDVLLADDLSLRLVPSAAPAAVGEHLQYSVTVSNAGPGLSTGVFVTNQLPANATFISAAADHGSVSNPGSRVIANIGSLAAGETAVLTVVVRPNGAGNVTNSAFARRNEAEVYLANNTITNVTPAVALALSVVPVTVREGDSGPTNALFVVSLSATSTQAVSVVFATTNSTATAGADYQAINGVLVFPPGTTNQTVAVPVFGDRMNEGNEVFFLTLTNATNAVLTSGSAFGTILNDDVLPMISIGDVTVAEGRDGLTAATFTLTLSQASGQFVTLSASTSDGTALGASDYVSTNLFVFFPPGVVTTQATVLVHGDGLLEADETFFLNLSNPNNATFADVEARATILNDENPAGVFDHFEWDQIPSPQTIQRGINATITARDSLGALVSFNGTAGLTANAGTNVLVLDPITTAPFVNGVWNGVLTLFQTGTNVVLHADDGAGHTGASSPFDVNVANLALAGSGPPQVLIASSFTYTFTITNLGTGPATTVILTNPVPPDASFVSASTPAGGCSYLDGVVRCDVGALTNGGTVTVTVRLNPWRGGFLTNITRVAAFEYDPVAGNNAVTNITQITGDEDRDALPDAWEADYGLSSSNPNDAALDLDGDGHTSLQEYIAGTDPSSPTSVLKVAADLQAGTAQISFLTALSHRYVLERSASPTGPWGQFGPIIIGDGDVVVVLDPEPLVQVPRYYRIQALR